jgi:uncharacterized protein
VILQSQNDFLFQRHAGLLCPRILSEIRAQFQLDWWGYHGVRHWSRVLENGLTLCHEVEAARADVVVLFALFHDACRENEFRDPEHGPKAALLAEKYHREGTLPIDPAGLKLLMEACLGHDQGRVSADSTIGVCWDADRLDLARVGITPSPLLLSTAAARGKELRACCNRASRRGVFPRREIWTVSAL